MGRGWEEDFGLKKGRKVRNKGRNEGQQSVS